MFDILDYFVDLRFSSSHHLGLGDIRLTVAQQEEIAQNCIPISAVDYLIEIYENEIKRIGLFDPKGKFIIEGFVKYLKKLREVK